MRALSRRDVSIAVALGALGYGAQAGGYFAALDRLDASLLSPTAASILPTLEPVVTVGLAFVLFGESLGPAPLAGGALVVSAIFAIRAPIRVNTIEKEAS